jgi:hypothetical protein
MGDTRIKVALAAPDRLSARAPVTGSPRNVSINGRCGFRVVEDVDAPDGGPHIWFMRSDS